MFDIQPTGSRSPIGRQREETLLWQQFELAAAGQTRVALLEGEPGIGKTTLLEGLAARAAAAGAVVLRGGAWDAAGMPPYLPFIAALGAYARAADLEALREQAAPFAAPLAALLPELAARLGAPADDYRLPPDQARLRLYEAIGGFLSAIAAPAPLVLLLDDLHWSDPATLDLLAYVARHPPPHLQPARLLVLGAYRPGEVDDQAAFTRMLAELGRQRRLATIAVGPLDAVAIGRLAAVGLGAAVTPELAEQLYRHSEGNPFFAEELLRGWVETGAATHARAGWRIAASAEAALPQSVAAAISQRLGRLPAEVIDLLRVAAVAGRAFDAALLAEVAGQPIEPVEERLAAAARARIVHALDHGGWAFGHDKIRECLYAEIGASRRRRLHGAIGAALERRGAEGPAGTTEARRLADLAFHYTRSGDRERGATYSRRAAEQALAAYAPAAAVDHQRAALALLDHDDPRRGAWLLWLGEAAIQAGQERAARAALLEARDWLARAGEPVPAARAALGAGRAAWRLEMLAEARESFEAALALLGDRRGAEAVEAMVELGSLLAVSLHRQVEGIAYARRALDLAWQLEDPPLVSAASRAVGNLLARANSLPEGLALMEQALAIAAEAGDPRAAAECCDALTMAYAWSASFARARDVSLRCVEYAGRARDEFLPRHVYAGMVVYHAARGEWAAAEHAAGQAQALVDRLSSPEPAAFLAANRGFLAHQRGDYPAAIAWYREAIAAFRAIGPGALVWYLGMLGVAQAAQGQPDEARACMAEVEGLLEGVPPGTMPTAEPLAHVVTIALALGDRARLARYGPRLAAFRGQYHDALVDRLLGEIAIVEGQGSAARGYLAAAEATARREGLRLELARVLAARAEAALGQPGRARHRQAEGLLAEAAEIFAALGNAPEERRLRERRVGLARPARAAAPAGLSEREVEVLRLVAAGRSNRQIAQALSLSEKTVANHLSSIFAKTGAENRAGATAFAIRHGLA